ncbi:peptidoglycan recognition protein family protein [Streptomyces pimonensis]|uniref:peptidoglycan recognition protein family protein n=1 Tax=Streptomyces pimonensis TaxID=2860288 RepID=UPI003528FCD6
MAWYPDAAKLELQPESDGQPAIRPTQFIVHSIVAPWTAQRLYEYWRSTSLESHFGLGYEGDIAQFIGTETRADANAGANRRPDGTGAVSIETASNTKASDPWTDAQVEELIKLGVWLHQRHGIPLRICRSHSDPGFGYHSLYQQWSTSGTACPGAARIKQFREVVFPGIVARATGKTSTQEDSVAISDSDAEKIAKKVLQIDGVIPNPNAATAKTNSHIALATSARNIEIVARRTERKLAALQATVDKLIGLVGSDVDTATVVTAVQKAIADAVVKVDVDITGQES